jgi:hypothetical protein
MLYFGLAWVCFGLGAVGAVLPVLPTTPFMLLALWAFSRSSARFHRWLYHHRVFGPRLHEWHSDRVVPLPVKLTAWTTMAASLALMIGVARVAWPVWSGAAALMLVGAIYLVRCPHRPPRREPPSRR